MKNFALLLVSILAVNVLSCAKKNHVSQPARSEFATKISKVLPQGWSLHETGNEIIITRQDPVTFFTCVALDLSVTRDQERFKQYVDRNSVAATYRIRVHRADKLDPSEYSRISTSNDQIRVTKSTMIPGREFYEDRAMSSFDARYRELPEYYDESSSIYVETTAHPYECAYPQNVAEECDAVRQRFDSLFTRYSKDTYRKELTYRLWGSEPRAVNP